MRTLLRLTLAACATLLPALLAFAQDAGPDGPTSVSRLDADPAFARGRPLRFPSRARRLDEIDRVQIDAQGRIVVAGRKKLGADRTRDGVARFLPDGRIDRSFGRRGVTFLPVRSVHYEDLSDNVIGRAPDGGLHDLSIDAQGRILLAGEYASSDGEKFLAMRLRADGSLDSDFSDDGLVEAAGQYGRVWLGARTSPADGSIVVVAWQLSAFSVVQLTPSGERDAAFGIAPLPTEVLKDFVVDAQGGAIVAQTGGVRRVRADGRRDTAFGNGNALTGAGGVVLRAQQLEADAQGRILAFGRVSGSTDSVHRYLADGTPDLSFSADGREGWSGLLPEPSFDTPYRFAIAADAERYAVATNSAYAPEDANQGRLDAGLSLSALDGSAPDALGQFAVRAHGPVRGRFVERTMRDLAVTPDGRFAILAGFTQTDTGAPYDIVRRPLLLRVDLTPREAIPVPELSLAFVGPVEFDDTSGGLRVLARLSLTNTGEADWSGTTVIYWLSDDDVLDADDRGLFSGSTGNVWAGQTMYVIGTSGTLFGLDASFVTGRRLIAQVNRNRDVLEKDTRNDVAVSAVIE